MAILATCACVVLAVAIDAACHRGGIRGGGQNFHFGDIAVARCALHACFQMRSVIPENQT
jgi:alpha-D-ribose 1-methylphosphonate 5-triphosphate synthase subunit PhnG